MNRIFLCALLVLNMNWDCLAQEKELEATIETNDGLKTVGYILIRAPHLSNEIISFRASTTDGYQEYYPTQLKSYTMANDLYESHSLDSTVHFFSVIIKGKASLYELSSQQKRYYLQMQGEEKVIWLRHEKMEISQEGSLKIVKLVSYYKEILRSKLIDCSSLDDNLPAPTEKELKAYVSKYNKCFSGNNYEQKELKNLLFLGVSAGVSGRAANYFAMGTALDFKNPRKKFLSSSLAYNFTRWEELEYDNALKKNVKVVNRLHWISYRPNITLFAGKVIEPYLLLDVSMAMVYEQGYGIGIVPFFLSGGGGMKINLGKNTFSRVAYVFPLFFHEISPASLNFYLSFRVK